MTDPAISQEAREALQSAWDAVATLPPIDFTEAEAVALAQAFEGEMVAKLRERARQASEVSRSMAEAKSLRQGGNTERRTDLYMWTKPEDTVEWKAADYIEAHLRTPAGEAGEMVEIVAEGLWALSRKKMGLQGNYLPSSRSDFRAEAITRLSATDTEAMRLLNCEEISIAHGQQVSITFKDPADAFALFDELKSRARIDALAKGGV